MATTPPTPAMGTRAEPSAGTSPLAILLAPTVLSELAHVFGMMVVVALCWGRMPPLLLAGWAVAVLGTTVTRGVVRRYSRTRGLAEVQALRLVRLTVGGQALAWGLGAMAAAPDLPFRSVAILLVMFAGLVAGALTTLTADVPAGRLFITGLMVPMAVGVLLNGRDREHLLGLLMLAVFSVFILTQMARANATIVAFHRSQEKLRESEAVAIREQLYTDALLESAPVAICTVGPDGRVGRVNRAFERLFGYGPGDAVGQVLDELIVPPSSRRAAVTYQEIATTGGGVRAEVERQRKDGTRVAVRLSAAQVEGTGTGELFVVYEDLTERRRAAETANLLAAIVESSEDGIYSESVEGTVVSWNAGAERLYGHAAADMIGKSIETIVPPDRLGELRELHGRVAQGERAPPFETERLRRDGTRVAVSLVTSAIRSADGTVIGFSKVARDIATQVAARRALEDARQAAERAARARSAFLANMSHEIRTPMNAILGLSELMLDTELTAEQRHALDTVRNAADGLLTLLNDVLDFSKIEAEHLELESVPFDLHQLVGSTVTLLAVRAGVKHLELLTDVSGEVPTSVRGDPTRLRQILTNLIGNAIKFTEQGEVVVSVAREGEGKLHFAVRDTGIGIPADKLDTIFEEFTQADASTTRHHGGTGLGLAIARRMVRLMGGELSVRSEFGKGSEFWFAIQLEQSVEHVATVLPPSALSLRGKRALVVDDSETNRRIVRDVLTGAGMTVDQAVDAAEGLAAIRRARADLAPYAIAILDVQMPERDGFALAGDVRADTTLNETKLLIFTSAGQRGDGQRCRDMGIEGYLSKPASRTELIEAASAVLGEPSSPDRLVTRHAVAEARRHLRILLAEDNTVNQEVAAAMLRKRGHKVDIAGNGREAVAAAARERYDVVLMDIMMPEMDGYQATAAIRATEGGRTLPIVACTAHALSGERERALAAGMSGYLAKPFKAHDLFAAVEGWDAPAPSAPAAASEPPSPIDIDSFRRAMREAGAEEAVDAILDTFVTTVPQRLADLERAVSAADPEAVRQAAHAYKSAAATIGAAGLAGQLGDMEAAARGGTVDGAAQAFKRIVVAHDAVLAAIARERAGA